MLLLKKAEERLPAMYIKLTIIPKKREMLNLKIGFFTVREINLLKFKLFFGQAEKIEFSDYFNRFYNSRNEKAKFSLQKKV